MHNCLLPRMIAAMLERDGPSLEAVTDIMNLTMTGRSSTFPALNMAVTSGMMSLRSLEGGLRLPRVSSIGTVRSGSSFMVSMRAFATRETSASLVHSGKKRIIS